MALRLTLDENIDCLAFCPASNFENLLVAGTYQLDENTGLRSGRLYQFDLETGPLRLALHASAASAGIFDVCWLACRSSPTLAVACTDGNVSLYDFKHGISLAERVTCFPKSLTTSVSEQNHQHHSNVRLCAAGASGELALLQTAESGLCVSCCWTGHDLEAWACKFDVHNEHVVYSGGDDGCLKGWDVRQPMSQPIFCNRRVHKAGVCCLAPSPVTEGLVLSGSYDECVRAWDIRNVKYPVHSAQLETGGGVWRLKFSPHDPSLLLAACMHNGFAVLKLQGRDDLSRVYEYPDQKTLAYDASWCCNSMMPRIIASGTFYDRALHVWESPL